MDANKQIALKRIHELFKLAKETIGEDPERAQRYVQIARHTSMTTKVPLPKEHRQLVCRHCKKFIFPGVSCRVRMRQRRERHVVVTCFLCGENMRFPLKERRKTKTRQRQG